MRSTVILSVAKNLAATTLIVLLAACQTHPHHEGREEFIALIDKNSVGEKQFSGLYENFEFRATFMNREVQTAVHNRLKKVYAWTDEEAQKDLSERMTRLNKSTRIWLDFFTPERRDDNLANKQTIWRVYLKNNGVRYEGRATKANMQYQQARTLFPYHSRWTTGYIVEFPVPVDQIQGDTTFIITGPLGRKDAVFKNVNM